MSKQQANARKNFSQVDTTLLLFTANWADNCYFTHPLWVRFANRFTTKKLKVLEIDCSRFQDLARSTFKINTSGVAN